MHGKSQFQSKCSKCHYNRNLHKKIQTSNLIDSQNNHISKIHQCVHCHENFCIKFQFLTLIAAEKNHDFPLTQSTDKRMYPRNYRVATFINFLYSRSYERTFLLSRCHKLTLRYFHSYPFLNREIRKVTCVTS